MKIDFNIPDNKVEETSVSPSLRLNIQEADNNPTKVDFSAPVHTEEITQVPLDLSLHVSTDKPINPVIDFDVEVEKRGETNINHSFVYNISDLVWKGSYNPGLPYIKGSQVKYLVDDVLCLYVAKENTPAGVEPTNGTFWELQMSGMSLDRIEELYALEQAVNELSGKIDEKSSIEDFESLLSLVSALHSIVSDIIGDSEKYANSDDVERLGKAVTTNTSNILNLEKSIDQKASNKDLKVLKNTVDDAIDRLKALYVQIEDKVDIRKIGILQGDVSILKSQFVNLHSLVDTKADKEELAKIVKQVDDKDLLILEQINTNRRAVEHQINKVTSDISEVSRDVEVRITELMSIAVRVDMIETLMSQETVESYVDEFGAIQEELRLLKSSIIQTASQITLKASETEMSTLRDTLRITEAKLTVQANRIAATVTREEFNMFGDMIEQRIAGLEIGDGEVIIYAKQSDFDLLSGRVDAAEASLIINTQSIQSKVEKSVYEQDKLAIDNAIDGALQRVEHAETVMIQTAESITAKADKSELDLLAQTVSDNSAELIIQADQISSKVSEEVYLLDKNTLEGSIEGLEGRISSAETSINQSAHEISLKASQTSVDNLGNRLSTAETNITQNANSIALRATKTEVTEEISTAKSEVLHTASTDATNKANSALTDAQNYADDLASGLSSEIVTITTRMSDAETAIDQNADNILLRATKSEVTSQIASAKSEAAQDASNKADNAVVISEEYTNSQVNILSGNINLKADKTVVDSLGTRIGQAELDIDGIESSITLKADKSEVNDLGSRVSEAELKITPEAINLTVKSQTENIVQEAVDGIEVSGRNLLTLPYNLLPNVWTSIGPYEYENLSLHAQRHLFRMREFEIESGEEYTISLEVKSNEEGVRFINDLVFINSDLWVYHNNPELIVGKYIKVYATFTYVDGPYNDVTCIYITGLTGPGQVSIRNLKIEKGDKATVWSPAPEDAINAVNTLRTETNTQFSVLDGQISSKVEQTTFDDLNVRVGTAESSISQNAGQIALRATKTEVTNQVSTAKSEAISTAASDATTKAGNAQSAAIASSKTYTDNQISVTNDAISLRATKTEVTSQIATAKSEAISTASGDATTKANSAKSGAVADAKVYTDSQITIANNAIALKADKTVTDGLNTRLNAAELKITPEAINLTVGGQIDEKIDGIEVGGRNLIKNSGNFKNTDGYSGFSVVEKDGKNVLYSTHTPRLVNGLKLKPNTEYVFSGRILLSIDYTGATTSPLHFWLSKNGGSNTSGYVSINTNTQGQLLPANTWFESVVKFKTASGVEGVDEILFTPILYTGSTASAKWLEWWKLEEGNTQTKWSPAPEDIDDRVALAEASISVQSDQINLRVTKEELNNLNIGGRNYWRYSGGDYLSKSFIYSADTAKIDIVTINGITGFKTNSSMSGSLRLSRTELEPSTVYTMSFLAFLTEDASVDSFNWRLQTYDGASYGTAGVLTVTKTPQIIKHTFTTRASTTYELTHTYNTIPGFFFTRAKLEKGPIASDWSPAPEDVDARIDTLQTDTTTQLNVLQGEINSKVATSTFNTFQTNNTNAINTAKTGAESTAKSYTDGKVNPLTTRVTNAESTITQHTSQINLRATKTEVDSAITEIVEVKDTRNTNQTPAWYFTNYPRRTVRELKYRSVVGLSGSTYCHLITHVPWGDSSGGSVTQEAIVLNEVYTRSGTSTTWSAWVLAESTTGAQSKATAAQTNAINSAKTYTDSQITIANNAISLKADKSITDSLTTRMSSAEAKITPDAINLTVKSQTQSIANEAVALSLANGKMLYTDPTLTGTNNNSMAIYPSATGTVMTRVGSVTDAPTANNIALKFVHTGFADSSYGGRLSLIRFANPSRANAVFITRIIAKLPVGWRINDRHNAYGNGGNVKAEWLTSRNGTGKWEEYVFRLVCGATGSFSTINHFDLTKVNSSTPTPTTANPIESYVCWATVYDMSEVQNTPTETEIKTSFTMTNNSISLLGQSIAMTGKVTYNSLNADVKNPITTAQNTANSALSTANTATSNLSTLQGSLKAMAYENVVGLAKLDSTVIEGGYIKTSLLNVTYLKANLITAANINALALNAGSITAGTLSVARLNIADIFAQNVTATGTINAKNLIVTENSKIGGFSISKSLGDNATEFNRLINSNTKTSLVFDNLGDSSTYLRINSDQVGPILAVGTSQANRTGIRIQTFASGVTGLHIINNLSGGTGKAIASYGNHEFYTRPGETWNAPGVLAIMEIALFSGSIRDVWSVSTISPTSTKLSTDINITHNLGHTDYTVMLSTEKGNIDVSMSGKTSSGFKIQSPSSSSVGAGVVWVLMVGRNKI